MITNELFNSWLNDTEKYQAGKTFEDLARDYGFKPEDILRLAGNESTIGTSPLAIKAAQEAATSSNFYAQPKSEALMTALEKDFASRIDMTNLGIVCGNGMDSVIEHVLGLFAKPGDSVINLSPSFIYYDFAAKRQGFEIIDAPRKRMEADNDLYTYKADIDLAISKIQDNTKIAFLCTPNNPDASIVSLAEIKRFADACLEKGVVLFIDHAYIEFTQREIYDAANLVKDYPNMIVGYTFSKAYAMAGFRVGYALMQKELKEKFLTLMTPFLISKVSIAAAIAALNDKEHLEKIINNNQDQRPALIKELQELGLKVYQSFANFILIETQTPDLFERLLKQGIIVRNMSKINALRISIGTKEENARLLEALKQVLNA